jgi:hypothetical protein
MPLPSKFDDINKSASSVLGDDYQVKGHKLEVKQKTNFDGAVSTTTIEFANDGIRTPGKLSWKFPKLMGIGGFSVDKLEYDKDGKYKFECSVKKEMHGVNGLAVEVKSDFTDLAKMTKAFMYTGIKDALIKVEARPMGGADMIKDFNLECLYGIGGAVVGAKFKGLNPPDVGVNFAKGDMFGSVIAKSTFSEFVGHCAYTVNKDIKVAGTYTQGGKSSGAWTVGGQTKIGADITAKAKLGCKTLAEPDFLSFGVKKPLVQGLVLTAGGQHAFKDGKTTYGLKLNVE